MAESMTGFARFDGATTEGNWTWELRSVNSRYLDIQLRLPESWRALETQVRDRLRSTLSRGKVECTLKFNLKETEQPLALNSERLQQTLTIISQVESHMGPCQTLNPLELMAWPGVLTSEPASLNGLQNPIMESLNNCIQELQSNRQREGQALINTLQQRLAQLETQLKELRSYMPELLAKQRQQFRQKCDALLVQLEPERLEQEIVLLLQKADIEEELDRLAIHIQEIRATFDKQEPIGRRLDFMMQELNREANTLSSKSIVIETTQAAIEMKVIIEQMREQVQNLT